jgi:hypothetical protein
MPSISLSPSKPKYTRAVPPEGLPAGSRFRAGRQVDAPALTFVNLPVQVRRARSVHFLAVKHRMSPKGGLSFEMAHVHRNRGPRNLRWCA